MVIICKEKYEKEGMDEHFNNYSFELSDFQKYAIDGIVNNNHVLVTAHTGSGKTLPAEFAIHHYCKKNRRVIYTSPIKALSNEKYHDFTKKFPDYSIGILTGDIKFNPDADVLIMTTEILQNHLYKRSVEENTNNSALNFDIDINDLACVIFDEIHYINDLDRGKVWEETILMLPENVSMLMLSATIDNPERFAKWCEDRYPESNKKVILTGTETRVVPLKHYIYLDSTEYLFKILKNKDKEKEIKKSLKKPLLIKDGNKINEENIKIAHDLGRLMDNKNCYSKPAFVLNSLITYLMKNKMLPGICFVFSRMNVEKYAHQITVNLFDDDESHIPSILPNECDNIIRKLSNYNEYKELYEYKELVGLMSKGVAIHHSGMMPILREIVEIIFSKGYIKVLFATETFAVGINMPTKTVIFTALSKYTSEGNRSLLSHEYTQMAGRAGRRGLDKIGYVIHCNNLFRNNLTALQYKIILSGKPQILQSKFKISYSLLLNLISNKMSYYKYIESSMLKNEITKSLGSHEEQLEKLLVESNSNSIAISINKINEDILNEYIDIFNKITFLNNKKRKQANKRLEEIKQTLGDRFKRDLGIIKNKHIIFNEIKKVKETIDNIKDYIKNNVDIVISILKDYDYVILNENDEEDNNEDKYLYKLTSKGVMASHLNECHSLVISNLIYNGMLDNLEIKELAGFMSCFTNISVSDDFKIYTINNKNILEVVNSYKKLNNEILDLENNYKINTGNNDEIHYDIIDEIMLWCDASDEKECLRITNLLLNKGIFVGEFVKAVLKITNIVNECITVCEYIGNIMLLEKLSKISDNLLKYIILQQSLYI